MKKALVPFFLIFCILSLGAQEKFSVPKTAQEALEGSRRAYKKGFYNLAEYYADYAIKDSSIAEQAAKLKIGCMEHLMKNSADSAKFITAALELHKMDPKDPAFLKPIVDYYSFPGRSDKLESFINGEIHDNPTDKDIWALKGEIQMQKHQWDEAISTYQQTIKLDSSFVKAIYNLGICYSSKALDLKDSLQNDRGKLNKDNMKRVLAEFENSKVYLEKASMMDPKCETVDWRRALYQAYYVLGEKKKARRVKSLL